MCVTGLTLKLSVEPHFYFSLFFYLRLIDLSKDMEASCVWTIWWGLVQVWCHGKPRPPMEPGRPLCWSGRGTTHCTKSRLAWGSTAEITQAILPKFGPPRGIKPYSCFGGLMLEKWWWSIVNLRGKGFHGAVATTRVWWCEFSNFPTSWTVAMGLLL